MSEAVAQAQAQAAAEIQPHGFYRTNEIERRLGRSLSRLLLRSARNVVQGVYRGKELHEAYDRLLKQCGGCPENRN